jgi:hypothetical protein
MRPCSSRHGSHKNNCGIELVLRHNPRYFEHRRVPEPSSFAPGASHSVSANGMQIES